MHDEGHELTELILRETEADVSRVYRKAVQETQKKLDDYLKRYKVKDKIKREQLRKGEITQDEYTYWKTGQIMIGKRWEEMRDTLARDLHNANKLARSVVQGYMPEVYALNHNYATFQVEKESHLDTSYTLYDRQTVERIIRDQPDLLPQPGPRKKASIAAGKDIAWQRGQIQSTMLQSILQGESIPNIAKRIARELGETNKGATVRYARTAATGAQNAGRVDAYKRAEGMGIELEQEWLATLDGRTRYEHRYLDGQHVPVGEPFKVDGYEIKFPGDPEAPGYLIWNCRCTLVPHLKNLDQSNAPRKSKLGDMSYDEWKDEHMQSQPVGIESLRQIAEQSTDKYDFWTNLDENQQSLFKASGMKLDDAFNQLHSGTSLPEWKAPAPGGPESFAVNIDASASTLKFNPIPARSKGWMADATDLGVINVRKDGLGDSWEFIISHEAGHQISNMSSELQQIIITNPGNVLGRYNTRLMAFDGIYGEYNPEEAFATGVSNFVRHPESMKRTYPEAYQAFNTLFTTSPSALEYVIQAMQRYKREFLL